MAGRILWGAAVDVDRRLKEVSIEGRHAAFVRSDDDNANDDNDDVEKAVTKERRADKFLPIPANIVTESSSSRRKVLRV